MLPLKIEVAADKIDRRIGVAGTIDSTTWPDLDFTLARLVGRDRSSVVLDLRGADYVSATAWSRLVIWSAKAKAAGTPLRIEGLQPYHTPLATHVGAGELLPVAA